MNEAFANPITRNIAKEKINLKGKAIRGRGRCGGDNRSAKDDNGERDDVVCWLSLMLILVWG
jgi:hypothetical protein